MTATPRYFDQMGAKYVDESAAYHANFASSSSLVACSTNLFWRVWRQRIGGMFTALTLGFSHRCVESFTIGFQGGQGNIRVGQGYPECESLDPLQSIMSSRLSNMR